MLETHVLKVAQELKLQPRQVAATAVLIEEGGTGAVYRAVSEGTDGELDEVQIMNIRDRLEQLEELDKRRDSIVASLTERNLLTEELKAKIGAAETMNTLEDIYLPFRPKKRTRATIAKEKGLEPLAELLWAQDAATNPRCGAGICGTRIRDGEGAGKGRRCRPRPWPGHGIFSRSEVSDDATARAKLRELYVQQGRNQIEGRRGERGRGGEVQRLL
jgi:uncharacterized protein